jgi:hypothetical protein
VKEREKESVHPECFIPKKSAANIIKLFRDTILALTQKASAFGSGKHFHPSLSFQVNFKPNGVAPHRGIGLGPPLKD